MEKLIERVGRGRDGLTSRLRVEIVDGKMFDVHLVVFLRVMRDIHILVHTASSKATSEKGVRYDMRRLSVD